ncbi:MAG: peptide chain release factor 2 [Alphaproteobacteria bacterium]
MKHLVESITYSLSLIRRRLDFDQMVKTLKGLDEKVNVPDLWSDVSYAQNILKQRETLNASIDEILAIEKELDGSKELFELAENENDNSIKSEVLQNLTNLKRNVKKLELETLFSNEADENDCFVEVHPGAGGTEAQDWANMLFRMYYRWAERRGFKVKILDENSGEEAGIKSVTFQIIGFRAYGWLKTESGVHRLVRISPFDANKKRHTSFASVWVYPVIDESIEIEINDSDLRIDTYRASGAGGQHVNKTDSAVRMTHIPTGIVVQCQSDRSQHRNRAQAMESLKSRLYELELRKREEEQSNKESQKTEIAWGHQIRSYVLHPYQMVKDTRTGVEKGNAHAVLDGDIDPFIEASLAAFSS